MQPLDTVLDVLIVVGAAALICLATKAISRTSAFGLEGAMALIVLIAGSWFFMVGLLQVSSQYLRIETFIVYDRLAALIIIYGIHAYWLTIRKALA